MGPLSVPFKGVRKKILEEEVLLLKIVNFMICVFCKSLENPSCMFKAPAEAITRFLCISFLLYYFRKYFKDSLLISLFSVRWLILLAIS